MMRKRFLIVVTLSALVSVSVVGLSLEPNVTIKGTATDCFSHALVKVPGVVVSLFDASTKQELLDSVRIVSTLPWATDPPAAATRMDVLYSRILQLADTATALARATTDSAGSFEVSVVPTDSLLLFATVNDEGQTYPYAYAVVGARTDAAVMLDLSRGGCNYIGQ